MKTKVWNVEKSAPNQRYLKWLCLGEVNYGTHRVRTGRIRNLLLGFNGPHTHTPKHTQYIERTWAQFHSCAAINAIVWLNRCPARNFVSNVHVYLIFMEHMYVSICLACKSATFRLFIERKFIENLWITTGWEILHLFLENWSCRWMKYLWNSSNIFAISLWIY